MYVCLCHSITDRQIRAAVARGARSLVDVQRDLAVATGCGTCRECAEQVIEEALAACPMPTSVAAGRPAGVPAGLAPAMAC